MDTILNLIPKKSMILRPEEAAKLVELVEEKNVIVKEELVKKIEEPKEEKFAYLGFVGTDQGTGGYWCGSCQKDVSSYAKDYFDREFKITKQRWMKERYEKAYCKIPEGYIVSHIIEPKYPDYKEYLEESNLQLVKGEIKPIEEMRCPNCKIKLKNG